MLAEFNARSFEALDQLVNLHKVQLRAFPPDVLRLLRELSQQVTAEKAAADPLFRKVHESFSKFQKGVAVWTRVADQAIVETRAL
jgi:TRAP-type mannitol/chloroaromatic compound transport system substrate-binding protein